MFRYVTLIYAEFHGWSLCHPLSSFNQILPGPCLQSTTVSRIGSNSQRARDANSERSCCKLFGRRTNLRHEPSFLVCLLALQCRVSKTLWSFQKRSLVNRLRHQKRPGGSWRLLRRPGQLRGPGARPGVIWILGINQLNRECNNLHGPPWDRMWHAIQ